MNAGAYVRDRGRPEWTGRFGERRSKAHAVGLSRVTGCRAGSSGVGRWGAREGGGPASARAQLTASAAWAQLTANAERPGFCDLAST
jgi:hypothetical protein